MKLAAMVLQSCGLKLQAGSHIGPREIVLQGSTMLQVPDTIRRLEHSSATAPDDTYLRLAIALALLAIERRDTRQRERKAAPELTASVVYLAANGVCEPHYVLS